MQHKASGMPLCERFCVLKDMPRIHMQAPEPGRYWALLQQWLASMSGWGKGSKLLIVHDNAESILSEPEGKKVRAGAAAATQAAVLWSWRSLAFVFAVLAF